MRSIHNTLVLSTITLAVALFTGADNWKPAATEEGGVK